MASYYRRTASSFTAGLGDSNIPQLEKDLTKKAKIQAFEDAMVDLGTFLEAHLKDFKAKVKKASKAYDVMTDADFDDEMLDELELTGPIGDDIPFDDLEDIRNNAKNLKGVTSRFEELLTRCIAQLKKNGRVKG